MIDWNKVIEQSLSNAPAIIAAVGVAYWRISKRQAEALANQQEIKTQLDGHTKLLRKASRAQGILEGHDRAKKEVKQDLADVVKTVKTAQKRARRSGDK